MLVLGAGQPAEASRWVPVVKPPAGLPLVKELLPVNVTESGGMSCH